MYLDVKIKISIYIDIDLFSTAVQSFLFKRFFWRRLQGDDTIHCDAPFHRRLWGI